MYIMWKFKNGGTWVRVSNNLNNGDFEERRRAMQRREATNAYKKNATYNQVTTNKVLEILQNLLSGKTEKELFDQDQPLLNEKSENAKITSIEANRDLSSVESLQSDMGEIVQSAEEIVSGEQEGNINRISKKQFEYLVPNLLNHYSNPTKTPTPHQKLENVLLEKTYSKAISSYTNHMQMAKKELKMNPQRYSYIA